MFTKIDIFSHIMTKKYTEKFADINPKIKHRVEYYTQAVVDLSVREKLMCRYPDVLQVLTMANIPLEKWVSRDDAVELAHIGNEELAELVLKRPDLFYGAVAVLPINDINAALKELDYAVNELGLLGVQLQTRIGNDWLADEKYRPILARMAELDKPIWIHPDSNDAIDNDIGIFSWPFETSHCMMRLVESGIFNDYPDLKFITHHAGAMIPFFKERIKYVMSLVPQPFLTIYMSILKTSTWTRPYTGIPMLSCVRTTTTEPTTCFSGPTRPSAHAGEWWRTPLRLLREWQYRRRTRRKY